MVICDIDPVVGKHPLEVSFDRVFPFFRNSNILNADYGRPLLKYLVYFPLTPFGIREVLCSMILLFLLS